MKNIFAVQLIIEDTRPYQGGCSSETSFINDMQDTFFEDFPEYKAISVESSAVWKGGAVRPLKVYEYSR